MKNPQTVQPKDVEMEDVENEGDFKKIDTKNLSAISLSAINNNLRNATNQFNDFATKKTASTGFFNIALVNKSLSIFFVILLNIWVYIEYYCSSIVDNKLLTDEISHRPC